MGKVKIAKEIVKAITPLATEGGKALLDKRSSEQSKHNQLLHELNENIARQLSFRENFKAGIIRGVGGAIGATIIAAIVFAILGQAVDTVDDVPIIRDIIDRVNIERTVDTMQSTER